MSLAMLKDDARLLIDGQSVEGARRIPVINPATEVLIAHCACADEAQLDMAIAAAKRAQPAWAMLDMADRRARLMAIADDLERQANSLASLLTAEQGKPQQQALMEVLGSAAITRALAALDLEPRTLDETPDGRVIEHRTPLGVVAAITPWNFPISLLVVKIVPALLAGNSVVAKPAATTPLSTLLLGRIFDGHLPPAILNIIVDDNDLGAQLTRHPDIAKIAFTGSTGTGRKVMEAAAGSIKRVTLELGGNDAAIVLDDADPVRVARSLFDGAMLNAGQVCLAIKRAYVHDSIHDAVCDELARLADAAIVGDGADPASEIGPVQNGEQYRKLCALLEETAQEASIISGGVMADRPGYFIRPTIVRDIGDDARLVREEQFGPILPVLSYSDIDDAVRRANDSIFGLGATVWSSSPARAWDVARRIDAGVVWVNAHMAVHPMIAVGGAKQSGIGAELGAEGLHEFTQRHVVFLPND